MLDLDVSAAKSNNMNPASQHVTENLLKHIDDNLQNQLMNQQSRHKLSSVMNDAGIVGQEELPDQVLELASLEDPSPYDDLEESSADGADEGVEPASDRIQESRRSNQFVNSPDQLPLPYQESGGRHSYLESERVEATTEEEESHGREIVGELLVHESPQIESNLIIDREKIQAAYEENLVGHGSGVAKTPASAGCAQPEPMISRASAAHSGGPQQEASDVSPTVINPRNAELTTYLD